MKSAINEIFRSAGCGFDSAASSAYDCGARDALNEKSAALEHALPPEHYAMHIEYVDALESVQAEEAERCFAEGFKMGLRLGLELDS